MGIEYNAAKCRMTKRVPGGWGAYIIKPAKDAMDHLRFGYRTGTFTSHAEASAWVDGAIERGVTYTRLRESYIAGHFVVGVDV